MQVSTALEVIFLLISGWGFDSLAEHLVRGQFGQRYGSPYWYSVGAHPSADF
jgi:hypothetical protein